MQQVAWDHRCCGQSCATDLWWRCEEYAHHVLDSSTTPSEASSSYILSLESLQISVALSLRKGTDVSLIIQDSVISFSSRHFEHEKCDSLLERGRLFGVRIRAFTSEKVKQYHRVCCRQKLILWGQRECRKDTNSHWSISTSTQTMWP